MKKVDWPAGLARDGVTKTILLLMLGWVLPSGTARVEVARGRWTKQAPIPTWFSLQGVAAISLTECGIASAPLLGDEGELAHTTDAGRTWTVVEMPRQVNAVALVDSLHGWAAGNAFFHTTDGGQTWIQDNNFGTIYDLFFLDTLHGWASGNGFGQLLHDRRRPALDRSLRARWLHDRLYLVHRFSQWMVGQSRWTGLPVH